MPRGDAVQNVPTVAEEMAKFQGFSTKDGEVSDGKPTTEEAERLAADAAQKAADKKVAGKNAQQRHPAAGKAAPAEGEEAEEEIPENETPAEKTAREAAAKVASKRNVQPGSVQDRINKATGRQRAAERALQAEREERARERGAFEARLSAIEKGGLTKAADSETVDPNAPNPKLFEYGELDPKFITALARYEAKKEFAAESATRDAQQRTAATTAETRELAGKVAAFEEAGTGKYDDFQEVVLDAARAGEWPLPETVGKLLFDSEFGHDIAYHLATHLDEAKKLEKMTPTAQAVAFGRLEAKFSSATPDAEQDEEEEGAEPGTKTPAKPAPKVSKAPVPIASARGGGKTQPVAGDTKDFAAFEAAAMGTQRH